MIGDEIGFGSLQNAERFGLDLLKRGVMWDALIREQLEDLGRFIQVLVAFLLQLVDTFLRCLFGRVSKNADFGPKSLPGFWTREYRLLFRNENTSISSAQSRLWPA
jgi:hypothetical protein